MKNFIFDLYGTLADVRTDESSVRFRKKFSLYLSSECGKEVEFWKYYDKLCADYSSGDNREFDIKEHIVKACAEEGAVISDSGAARAAVVFRRLSLKKLRLYRGVTQMLASLKNGGAKIYLLSNAQSAFTRGEIDSLGLTPFFDGMELSSDFGYKKPSPLFFNHLITKYNIDPAQSVFVGNDIGSDIVPAKAAGMSAAYILSDISPAGDDLYRAQQVADFAVKGDVKTLSEYLLQLLKG